MMLFKRIFSMLCFLVIFTGSALYGQMPKVQAPSKRSVADLQALPDDTLKALYFNRVAWDTAYYNLTLGAEYAQEGLKVAKRIKYDLGIIMLLNTLGATYNDMGEYDEALDAHMEALGYCNEYGDPRRTGTCLMNMSLVYSSIGDTVNAKITLEKAVASYESINYERGLSAVYINLGSLYMRTNYFDEAKDCFRKSQALADKMDVALIEAHSWSALGVCHAHEGDNDSADYCMRRAHAIADTLDDPYTMAQVMSNNAAMYMFREDYTNAERCYRICLKNFGQIGVREEVVDLYNHLSELFELTNNTDSSLKYWKKYMLLRDSLVNEDVLNHQRNLEAKYESEQRKQEIELETKKGDTRQWFLWAIVIAGVVLIFLVVMLFRRNQFRKKLNRETSKQNSLIEEKNRNITDSINYASRIQEAVVPSVSQLKNSFRDAFVLSKPKDIVSGDFWWCSERSDGFFLAGADSTGHGVPGGFMSMLGSVFLFEIVTEGKVSSPAEILNQLRDKVIRALKRSGALNSSLKDGMDMVMCRFSPDRKKLEFSCAMNPLWVIRGNSVIEYRADKFPVGEYLDEVKPFTLLEHHCEPGDMIYIFSDGYADQFGGPDGKKMKYKQLRDILCSVSGLSCTEQHKILNERFTQWKGIHEQVDDVLVIGIRI